MSALRDGLGEFGWQFVQLIPLSEFEATMRFEQNTINLVLLFSVLLSMLLSYLTTKKLFARWRRF